MPPHQQKKQQYKKNNNIKNPQPKIYGFFTSNTDSIGDDNYYDDVSKLLIKDLKAMYPSLIKSCFITNVEKNEETSGKISINLTEVSKDLTQENFNHLVRIVKKQESHIKFVKLFYVSTLESEGIKYSLTNLVKNKEGSIIPSIYTFCESNNINLENLKDQVRVILKDDYMDAFAIVNKSKSSYNINGGFFIKFRLVNEIDENIFKKVGICIKDYFADNYDEDQIKIYYKTGNEVGDKKYTFTHPSSNKIVFLQDN